MIPMPTIFSPTIQLFLIPPLTYLLGSISFSFLVGKLQSHDLRGVGSGNLGAMNAARVLGLLPGLVVLALDLGKGAAAVEMARTLSSDPMAIYLACFFVMLGHNYSAFLKFSGGKGIATVGGCLLLLSPKTMLAELIIGGLTSVWTKNVHSGGLAMIFALPPLFGYFTHSWNFFILGLALASLCASRHRKEFRELFGVVE